MHTNRATRPNSSEQPPLAGTPMHQLALLAHNDSFSAVLSDVLRQSKLGDIHAYNCPVELAASGISFDALVIDLDLPDNNGLSICTEQRQRHPRLTILAMSARSGISQRVAALNAGADQFLEKPVSHPELIAGLRRGLARGRHF